MAMQQNVYRNNEKETQARKRVSEGATRLDQNVVSELIGAIDFYKRMNAPYINQLDASIRLEDMLNKIKKDHAGKVLTVDDLMAILAKAVPVDAKATGALRKIRRDMANKNPNLII